MRLPPPMHYAVKISLEDGLSDLDAGRLRSGDIPSGVVMSLRVRRAVLEAALEHFVWPGGDCANEALAEFTDIERLLNALDGKDVK